MAGRAGEGGKVDLKRRGVVRMSEGPFQPAASGAETTANAVGTGGYSVGGQPSTASTSTEGTFTEGTSSVGATSMTGVSASSGGVSGVEPETCLESLLRDASAHCST